MAVKFNASQFRSKIRQAENKYKQQINKVNQEIDKYNRNVKRAVNNYNSVVRQHNAKVLQNRARIQSELRKLTSSSSARIVTTYRTSVDVLHTSYRNVAANYDMLENVSPFQDFIYSSIEQENANNLEAANVVLDNAQPEVPEYSLQDTKIMNRLSSISKDLDDRWKGALFSLNPINPDAARHFCTSAREIFSEIFDSKATDGDVFSAFPDCKKTDRGNASRQSKIKYFMYKKSLDDATAESFVENDIANILELFHVLSTGTHGASGKYTYEQLSSIKKRVEDGLIFLCDIAS